MTVVYDVENFHNDLVKHGLIIPATVKGAYGRGPVFEDILRSFDALVMRRAAADGAEEVMFPPIVPRALVEKLGYMDNFPQLCGSIHSFMGTEQQAREISTRIHDGQPWTELLSPTDVMLAPAACYPVYPLFSGLLPQGGRLVTVINWIFRHEPSDEPTRLQAFRMREFIRAGRPEQVTQWRDMWLERSVRLFEELGLPVHSDIATDPFFGRVGKMMAANQLDQHLKFELQVPVISVEKPTAIASFNWHQEHFSGTFGFRASDESVAHTACVGFGLERVTLAMVKAHGFDPKEWPREVRSQLWP
ncbi:MAG TPA: amino acid--[acyl-carrier-protein] ligase [Ramlibacter sp.]|nr:amino acid--[acyl-carrier-protein] ligase [Ramlibacter sp.]